MKQKTKALCSTVCLVSFFLSSSLPALASPLSVTQKHTQNISSSSTTHKVSAVIIKKRMSLTVGHSETLAVKIAPAKADNNVTWASTNTAVATVNSNGEVVGVSTGTAYVTVTTKDGSKAATCTVTVGKANVALTGVTLNQSTLNLTAGGATGTLTATVVPLTSNQNVTWTSSDPNVATVNANGVVTPVVAGTAKITATTADGLKTATCTVTVVAVAPVISNVTISSNNADNTKAMNGDTIILTFTSSEPVTKLSNFKINGSNPNTFTNNGNIYTATHLVDSGDLITGLPATFQINVKDSAGLYSQTIETTSNGSTVTIIAEYARISKVMISSNNTSDPTKATIGDTITLKFTTDEAVTKLSNFKINSSNPDSFVEVNNNDGTYTYTAIHLVDSGDPVTNTPVTFQINVDNTAGIYSPTVETTSDGSTVTIQ